MKNVIKTSDKRENKYKRRGFVGDGGASWRAKALKRANERAQEEKRDVAEVVQDRFASTSQTRSHIDASSGSQRHSSSKKRDRRSRSPQRSPQTSSKSEAVRQSKSTRKPTHQPVPQSQGRSDSSKDLRSEGNKRQLSSTDVKKYPPGYISKERLNKLSAKALKAKLLGDAEKHKKLTSKIEEMRAVLDAQGEIETLDDLDEFGRHVPLVSKLHQDRDEKDPNMEDIDTLKLREKLSSSYSYNKELADVLARNSSFMQMNQEEQFDVASESLFDKRKKRRTDTGLSESEKHKQRQIQQHNKFNTILEKCWHCLKSPKNQRHLTVCLGSHVYIAIPATPALTKQHCLIVPMEHISSTRSSDDSVRKEIEMFKINLSKMFESQNRCAIFLEAASHPRKKRHAVIECIPISADLAQAAPIYFKKGIVDADDEWSVHKKLIDTRKKDFFRSIPDGFPYFHVEFGVSGGFAHVIENELLFDHNFGKEILCGILEESAQIVLRRRVEPRIKQRQRVKEFLEDWRKMISEEKPAGDCTSTASSESSASIAHVATSGTGDSSSAP